MIKLPGKSIASKVHIDEGLFLWTVAIVVGIIMTIHLVYLVRFPPVFIDESWYSNVVWNYLKTGSNFDSLHVDVAKMLGISGLRWPNMGFIDIVFWSIGARVLGFGLFQLRLVSWIFGLLLLTVTFLVGERLYGKATGIIATLLLSLSPPFLQASHYVRPDVMLAAAAMLSFLLLLLAVEKEKWWAHFISGLILGLSLDIHPNAILFVPGTFFIYLLAYKRGFFKKLGIWLNAAGFLIGIFYFITVQVLPDLQSFFIVYKMLLSYTHDMPLLSFSLTNIIKSAVAEIGRYHFYDNGLDFALIGAGILYVACRRLKSDRKLLLLIITAFIGFVLIVGNKHDIYAINLYPFLALIVSETLVSLFRDVNGSKQQRIFISSFFIFMLINSAFHFGRPISQYKNYDYYAITDKIKNVIPMGSRIIGLPNWWLGFTGYDYKSNLNLTYYHFIKGYDLSESLEQLHPDFIIVDNGLRDFLVDQDIYKTGAGFEIYKLPRQEFYDFLTMRGEKIMEFSDRWHGIFQIYAIHWDKDVSWQIE